MTRKEEAIISVLGRWSLIGKQAFTLDEICRAVYSKRYLGPPTPHARNGMAATLRNLSAKAQSRGLRLFRSSGIGRGAKARYEFQGDFSRLRKRREVNSRFGE